MNSLIALISNDLRHRWTLFLAGREKKPNSGKSKQAIKVEISEWKGGRKNDSVLAAVPLNTSWQLSEKKTYIRRVDGRETCPEAKEEKDLFRNTQIND